MITSSRRRLRATAAGIAVLLAGSFAVSMATAPSAAAGPGIPGSGSAAILATGSNDHGQLGIGSTTSRTSLQLVSHDRYLQVANGATHTVAINGDGTGLEAWGDNTYGELGTGTTTSSTGPEHVVAASPVGYVQVTAGAGFSAARNESGQVFVWGRGNFGQLGVGAVGNVTFPIRPALPAGTHIQQISAGYGHLLAVSGSGVVYAWGLNNFGQLGDGTTTNRLSPVAVHLPAGVTPIGVSAGYAHSLVLTQGGGVYAFGRNNRGQLGTGSLTDSALPVLVNTGVVATAVAAGGADSLVGTAAGGVRAWGDNTYGELGIGRSGSALPYSSTPRDVVLSAGQDVATVSAGYAHNLLTTTAGEALAFGDNTYGQLGTDTGTASSTPIAMPLHSGVTAARAMTGPASQSTSVLANLITTTAALVASTGHSTLGRPLTVTATVSPVGGGVMSFVSNAGPLPGCTAVPLEQVGGETYRARCTSGPLPPGTNSIGVTYVPDDDHYAANANVIHVNAAAGVAVGWGLNSTGQLGTGGGSVHRTPTAPQLPAGSEIVSSAADHVHGLAATASGTVYAWGDNSYGEIGDGTTTARPTPVQVTMPPGTKVVAVAAGDYSSVALTDTGAVYAWGCNLVGQLGDGTTSPRSTSPVAVHLPTGVSIAAVSAGYAHVLALTTTGEVYSWGLNNVGQLGRSNGGASTPGRVALPAGTYATTVAAGYAHSLATTVDGGVLSWGENVDGELGNGTTTRSNTPAPAELPVGVHAIEVSAGFHTSLALLADGGVLAWGDNTYGRLGDGTTSGSATPVVVALPSGAAATSVVATAGTGSALTSTGEVFSWGDNTYGELGTGSAAANSPTPVKVALPEGGAATALGSGPYALSAFAVVPRIRTASAIDFAPNPSPHGQPLAITDTVTPSDDSGTVAFSYVAASDTSAPPTPVAGCAAVPLVASGGSHRAGCTTSALPAGTYYVFGDYSGDTLYQPDHTGSQLLTIT